MERPKIGIVFGSEWLEECDRIPKVQKRVSFQTLVKPYFLLRHFDVANILVKNCQRFFFFHFRHR